MSSSVISAVSVHRFRPISVAPIRSEPIVYPTYWQNLAREPEKSLFDSSLLTMSDGHSLHVYEAGNPLGETILLVCPIATPFLLLSKLAGYFLPRFHLISWEIRGGPYLEENTASVSLSLSRHAKDLVEVLMSKRTDRIHCIGWCDSIWIICWAILRLGVSIASVSLIAPTDVVEGEERTRFQQFIVPLIRRAVDADTAGIESILRIIQEMGRQRPARSAAEGLMNRILSLNAESAESMRRFARALSEFSSELGNIQQRKQLFDELCTRIRVQVLHCRDDEAVCWKNSVMINDQSPNSKLVLYPSGGHFAPYLTPKILGSDIESFICG